ncbi:hypothetical protein [Nonomuraea sp. NPDC049695]|uniref:hypothetical protein n=1 Tax=Nonomuraea sp. NPDC049695 TaxID=3154734 RepID=UPI00341F58AA
MVRRLNATHRSCYPEDLPLDVIGTLNGWTFSPENDLEANLTELGGPEDQASLLTVFAALWYGDEQATRRLRESAQLPEPVIRRQMMQLTSWYGYEFLLHALAESETEPELLAEIEERLASPLWADTYNAFNEHLAFTSVMVDEAGTPVETWSDSD